MKTIKLVVLSMQILADGSAVLLTRPSKENPSANGVHKLAEGQIRRISQRAIGVNHPMALKSLVDLGECKLNIDAEVIKPGDTYIKRDGSTGTYKGATNADGSIKGDGTWTKYQNHEIELSEKAKNKLADKALDNAMNSISYTQSAPKVVAVVEQAKEETPEV